MTLRPVAIELISDQMITIFNEISAEG
jgi:hypothetical protein